MIPKVLNNSMKRSSSTKNYIKKSPILQTDSKLEKSPILLINNLFKPKKLAESSSGSRISLFTSSGKSLVKSNSKKSLCFIKKKEAKIPQSKISEPTLIINQIFGCSKDLRPPHKSPQPSVNPTAQSPIFDTLQLSYNQKNTSKLASNIFQKLRGRNTFRTRRLRTPF